MAMSSKPISALAPRPHLHGPRRVALADGELHVGRARLPRVALDDHVDIDVGVGQAAEDLRGHARMVRQAEEADLGLVAAVGHAAHDPLLHDLLLVADDGAGVVARRPARRSSTAPAAARAGPWPAPPSGSAAPWPPGRPSPASPRRRSGPGAGPWTRSAGRWCRRRPRRCRCRSGRPSAPRPRPRRRGRPSRRGRGWPAGPSRSTPWKPATTGISPASSAASSLSGGTSSMRARPWASSVMIGICQPSQRRARRPMLRRVMASSPAETCSPEATTTSYSSSDSGMPGAAAPAPSVQATSSLVRPAMAETTTATCCARRGLGRHQPAPRGGCAPGRPPRCRRISSPAETQRPGAPRQKERAF